MKKTILTIITLLVFTVAFSQVTRPPVIGGSASTGGSGGGESVWEELGDSMAYYPGYVKAKGGDLIVEEDTVAAVSTYTVDSYFGNNMVIFSDIYGDISAQFQDPPYVITVHGGSCDGDQITFASPPTYVAGIGTAFQFGNPVTGCQDYTTASVGASSYFGGSLTLTHDISAEDIVTETIHVTDTSHFEDIVILDSNLIVGSLTINDAGDITGLVDLTASGTVKADIFSIDAMTIQEDNSGFGFDAPIIALGTYDATFGPTSFYSTNPYYQFGFDERVLFGSKGVHTYLGDYAFFFEHGNSNYGFAKSSGTQKFMLWEPRIQQSGTAYYEVLRVDVDEESVGSGQDYLMCFRVNGDTKFTLDTDGNTETSGSLTIGADTNVTAVPGTTVFQASDSTFYGCRSATANKKWYALH